jgi:hypothetical protein
MAKHTNSGKPSAAPQHYAICVRGRLEPCWSEWFSGLTITPAGAEQQDTLLLGPVADQAALHGILNRIGSLGLTLIAVNWLDRPGSAASGEPAITRPEESNSQRDPRGM